jgi:hypothetical protein
MGHYMHTAFRDRSLGVRQVNTYGSSSKFRGMVTEA